MDEIKGVYYLGTWAVVVVGWLVVNHQNNIREARKEIRTELNDLFKFVDGITAEAVAYHRSADASAEAASKIRLGIQRLNNRVRHLNMESDELWQSLRDFRKAITYDNFDSKLHVCQRRDSTIVEEIHSSADGLYNELEGCFSTKYRRTLKQIVSGFWSKVPAGHRDTY